MFAEHGIAHTVADGQCEAAAAMADKAENPAAPSAHDAVGRREVIYPRKIAALSELTVDRHMESSAGLVTSRATARHLTSLPESDGRRELKKETHRKSKTTRRRIQLYVIRPQRH